MSPIRAGTFPGLSGAFPGLAGVFPGLAGAFPGLAGAFPGLAGTSLGLLGTAVEAAGDVTSPYFHHSWVARLMFLFSGGVVALCCSVALAGGFGWGLAQLVRSSRRAGCCA